MPTPKAPSTHIVKLSRPETSRTADLIDTEAAALDLARQAGISDVQAHLQTFADKRAIVVTRYDRVPDLEAATVQRLHQEDAAQMLGLNTDDPLRKFQYGAAIPSLAAIAGKLAAVGIALEPLLALTTLNLAIGNVDAHAKNISVLHNQLVRRRRRNGRLKATPPAVVSRRANRKRCLGTETATTGPASRADNCL